MTLRAIHQLTPYLAYGDAVGNQIRAVRDLLREWGYASEIFSDGWDSRSQGECLRPQDHANFSDRDNLLIHHYVGPTRTNLYLLTVPDHPIFYYHNVTPDYFFSRLDLNVARGMRTARRDLVAFNQVPAIAASPYNREELQGYGFHVLGVAPYLVQFKALEEGRRTESAAAVRARFGDKNLVTWLYVGRLAPNKCIQDIVKAFYYFHRWISPDSQLLLVGSERDDPYVQMLHRIVEELGLADAVRFAGHYGAAEGLAAFYELADIYISMSEHEGFCVPLIEAMHFNVPVLAYASSGVPLTMGGSGALVTRKDHALIAEVANEILTNQELRQEILKRQATRVNEWAPEKNRERLLACLEAALAAQTSA